MVIANSTTSRGSNKNIISSSRTYHTTSDKRNTTVGTLGGPSWEPVALIITKFDRV